MTGRMGSSPNARHSFHHPKPLRRQRQAVPADGGVFPWRGHRTVSPHPPLEHLHMQRRRKQIHGRKAHFPYRDAHLITRQGMAIEHKGNAAAKETEKAKLSDPYFSIFAMLSSPRSPSRTVRILSSAEWCLRVARRISRTSFSAGTQTGGMEEFWLIFTPVGVTMNQKSSVPQPRQFVSRALTSDNGGVQLLAARYRSENLS